VRSGSLRDLGAAAGGCLLPLQAMSTAHRHRCLDTGLTQPGSFAITQGSDAVRTYRPGDDGWHKSFCAACGSQLFTTSPENPDLIAVRLGALDEDPGVRPSVHQFVDYAAPWAPVPDDGLPRFPERMAWK
jgi:hypothetical protein